MTNTVTRKDLSKGFSRSIALVKLNGSTLIVNVVKRIDDENVVIYDNQCIEYAESVRQGKARIKDLAMEARVEKWIAEDAELEVQEPAPIESAEPVEEEATPVLSEQQAEKASRWGTFMGKDMAVRQYTKLYFLTGLVSFFSKSEIELNAKISAQGQAVEYSIPAGAYAEWEQVFVGAYSTSYRDAVQAYEEKQAAKQAMLAKVEVQEPAPVESIEEVTTIKHITIYQQGDKTYCQSCKPKGGKRGTLVLSGVDHMCDGCGQDFLEMAQDVTPKQQMCEYCHEQPTKGGSPRPVMFAQDEAHPTMYERCQRLWLCEHCIWELVGTFKTCGCEKCQEATAEPVEDDEELSPSDLAAIESAMQEPDLGPYSMAELTAMVEQAQEPRPEDVAPAYISCALCDAELYEGHEHTCGKCKRQVCDFDFTDVTKLCNECHITGLPTDDLKALRDAYERTERKLTEAEDMFYHEVVKEIERREPPQPETLYTVEDTRLALPVHYLTPNAVSPAWYSPQRFSGIKEASDAFVVHHGKPARYVDPYQFGVFCKLRMEEWEAWLAMLSYLEEQAARFVAESEHSELAVC